MQYKVVLKRDEKNHRSVNVLIACFDESSGDYRFTLELFAHGKDGVYTTLMPRFVATLFTDWDFVVQTKIFNLIHKRVLKQKAPRLIDVQDRQITVNCELERLLLALTSLNAEIKTTYEYDFYYWLRTPIKTQPKLGVTKIEMSQIQS